MLLFEKDRFALAGVRRERASILLGGSDSRVCCCESCYDKNLSVQD